MVTVKYIMLLLLAVSLSLTVLISNSGSATNSNPIEAGDVNWGRDLDTAIAASKESGTPVFVLFQEIPGCLGCRNFGSQVLTQPLLVAAIESEFLPVLVYNNRPGTQDEKWLKRYREPSWNYQVIRFLDGEGKDIIPRKDKVWSVSGLAMRMIEALEKVGKPVPSELRSLLTADGASPHS